MWQSGAFLWMICAFLWALWLEMVVYGLRLVGQKAADSLADVIYYG